MELLEEAVHLVRTAPAVLIAVYAIGTLPFVLALLYFWADMSQNAYGARHLLEASLGMGVAFIWMKLWHVWFGAGLQANLKDQPMPGIPVQQWPRLLRVHVLLQPLGLFLLPAALIVVVPFGWVYAFFQYLTVSGVEGGVRDHFTRASRLSLQSSGANHSMLFLLLAFGFAVFLNCATVGVLLPFIVKLFSGVESAFTRSPGAALNSTYLAAVIAATYVCVDPIVKAAYVLRCFYAESVVSGEDLLSQLNSLKRKATMLLVCGILTLSAAPSVAAQEPNTSRAPVDTRLSPDKLDGAIRDVLAQRKYEWRMPRETGDSVQKGVLAKFLEDLSDKIRSTVRAALNRLDELLRKLFKRNSKDPANSSGYGWMLSQHLLLWALIVAAAIALALFLLRWLSQRQAPATTETVPMAAIPDLRDESVAADQLPGDSWMQLGRELLDKGEFRLALRAFYLSSLALLADEGLIRLARYKSNRDYLRELGRRQLKDIPDVFKAHASFFEQGWYGEYPLDRQSVEEFAAGIEKLRPAQ